MNDVQFHAAALARHRASVERHLRASETTLAERPAQPVFKAEVAAPARPREVAAPVATAAEPAPALPTLSTSQLALLEQSFAPASPVAPPPAPSAATLDDKAKAAAVRVELTPQQSALLAQSLGLTGGAAGPQALADSGIPVAREVSAMPRAKTADPSLSPDQMALLMASLGVAGHPALPEGTEEPVSRTSEATTAPAAPVAAVAPDERRFFPIAPRAGAGSPVPASDAYLRAVQTVERNLGRQGL